MPGPFVVDAAVETKHASSLTAKGQEKPWFIGIPTASKIEATEKPLFVWKEAEGEIKRTRLNQVHRDLGGRMVPFAGWEMPVVYTSIYEEHLATRQAAGLFDVSHMGVYEVKGTGCGLLPRYDLRQRLRRLAPGESLYSQFMTPDADVIDDTLVYRRAWDKYLVVVNASNDDKDRTWFESVRDGKVKIDNARPFARGMGTRRSSATCATRRRVPTCASISPCKAPGAATSCWPWAWTIRLGRV